MVGVKGKYKGCNTCRKRRVACDNTRPLCKKCTDHGRPCEGYRTETVFIVGTLEDKGRCASHPPRNLQSGTTASSSPSTGKKKAAETKSSSLSPEPAKSRRRAASEGSHYDAKLEFTEISLARSSWEEFIHVASFGGLHKLRFAAIHTRLRNVRRHHERLGDWEMILSLPDSKRLDVTPTFAEGEFRMKAECFIYLPRNSWRLSQGQSWGAAEEEGLCLFLFEQNTSASYSNKPPWKDPAALNDPIRRSGPQAFKAFPGHHFFTRIYRPNAVFAALLNHNSTHLADPDWQTTPFESSPKTAFDNLIDVISKLPSLRFRSDRIMALPTSVPRHLKAKDLLNNCVAILAEFDSWYAAMEAAAARNIDWPLLYWQWKGKIPSSETAQWEQGQVPFEATYDFPSAEGGLAHIYYWTGLIVLYGIMAQLFELIKAEGGSSGTATSTAVPATTFSTAPNPPNTSMTYLQLQHQGYVYGSPAQSYASASTDDTTSPPTSASLPYFQHNSGSPYHASTSPLVTPEVPTVIDLPRNLDPNRFGQREIRKLAANICRSLDWAIGRSKSDGLGPLGQPDLVAAPLHIVEGFYQDIGLVGDGELERLWCAGFRQRWEQRGREIEAKVLGRGRSESLAVPGSSADGGQERAARSWIELGTFGL